MMQVIDADYVRSIAELPDGYERLHRWFASMMDERDTAEAVAKACVAQIAPLKRQIDDLRVAANRDLELRREIARDRDRLLIELTELRSFGEKD